MSAPKAILNKPATIITLFPQLKPRKHIKFPTSKLVFTEELVSHKTVSCNGTAWSLNAVTRSTKGKALAFNDNAGDEGVKDIEQQGFISEFSQFHPESIVADGLESTLNRLSMGIVAVCFSAILLWRHDAEALWATVGFGLNLGLSTMLKEILNQERPVSATRYDPGMPSTHAQSIFFVVVFTVLSMVELLGVNGLAITLSGAVLAFGSYLSWLRVSQQFHTIGQVVVGAMVGSIFSFLWILLWDATVLEASISIGGIDFIVVLVVARIYLDFLLCNVLFSVVDERWTS